MDVLVEFCRTGELGPLRKGSTAAEVERLLGPPEDVKLVHGDDNWQRYRYGSMSLVLMRHEGEPTDKENLRLRSIRLRFDRLPLDLPERIAQDFGQPWTSSRLDDLLTLLHGAGVDTTLAFESSAHDTLQQRFTAGPGSVAISAFDGELSIVEA